MRSKVCDPATVEEFQRVFSVNVLGTFLCYKYAAQHMIEQGRGGRIIGASSVAGKAGQAFNMARQVLHSDSLRLYRWGSSRRL